MSLPRIIVLGSLNVDLVSVVFNLPAAGETCTSDSFSTNYGGKGANQAVAAAKLGEGIEVKMIGCVGDDSFGGELKEGLIAEGVNVEDVRTVEGRSGVAVIIVERDSGENRIMISPGANAAVTAPSILDCSLLITQLEIPKEVVFSVIRNAKVPVLFNPTPAVKLPEDIYALVEILVVNKVEAMQLTGLADTGTDVVAISMQALDRFVSRGSQSIVITLGASGALFYDSPTKRKGHVPAEVVAKVVDSTGAGDTFVGALATEYVRAHNNKTPFDLEQSIKYANKAAAHSVQRPGTWRAMPLAKDLR